MSTLDFSFALAYLESFNNTIGSTVFWFKTEQKYLESGRVLPKTKVLEPKIQSYCYCIRHLGSHFKMQIC